MPNSFIPNQSSSSVPSGMLATDPGVANSGTNVLDANVVDPLQAEQEKEYAELFDFVQIKPRLQKLVSVWDGTITRRANEDREIRYKDLNIAQLREQGIINDNEFMIPVRSVDQNIRREQPAYINFIKQSKRLVIFKDILDPTRITTRLENEFSRGMTYSGWETPHFRCVDGAQTHGWDWCEVCFDQTKPLHVGIEHVGFEKLIFPLDAHDIQACQIICRVYSVSPRQLKNFVKNFDFDAVEVDKLLKKDISNVEKNLQIYKKYCKYEGVVYVSWFSLTADNWLLSPRPLYIGRQILQQTSIPVPVQIPVMDGAGNIVLQTQMEQRIQEEWVDVKEGMFPVFRLPYIESERAKLVDCFGRVFMDKHKQEAKTANISQFLNASQKSSEIYTCVDTDNIRNEAELQSLELQDDIILPYKLKFFSPPAPDSTMLSLQNYLDAFDSQEAGRMDFAAINRQDSRKTATEVNAAREESAILGTIQVSLYSRFIREMYSFAWEIVKSQAAQGKITFLANEDIEKLDVVQDPTMSMLNNPSGAENPELAQKDEGSENLELLNRPYDIRAAGDVDVVRRLETIAQYKEFWPIVAATPIAIPFLARLIRLALPEDGDMFATMLMQGDPRAILLQLVQIIESTLTPQELMMLSPEQQMILQNIMIQAKQISAEFQTQQMGAGSTGQNPAQSQPSAPKQNNQNAVPAQ